MGTTTRLAQRVMEEPDALVRAEHAELFERTMGRIHRYFSKMLRSTDDADECTQQTLLLLEDSIRNEKYDPQYSFNTWLWLKARTVFAQWCRARGKAPIPVEDFDHVAADSSPSSTERQLAAARALGEVRRRAGEEAYEAFVLYYEGGLTQGEICDVLSRDRKTVATRLRAAHRVLDAVFERGAGPS